MDVNTPPTASEVDARDAQYLRNRREKAARTAAQNAAFNKLITMKSAYLALRHKLRYNFERDMAATKGNVDAIKLQEFIKKKYEEETNKTIVEYQAAKNAAEAEYDAVLAADSVNELSDSEWSDKDSDVELPDTRGDIEDPYADSSKAELEALFMRIENRFRYFESQVNSDIHNNIEDDELRRQFMEYAFDLKEMHPNITWKDIIVTLIFAYYNLTLYEQSKNSIEFRDVIDDNLPDNVINIRDLYFMLTTSDEPIAVDFRRSFLGLAGGKNKKHRKKSRKKRHTKYTRQLYKKKNKRSRKNKNNSRRYKR